MRPLMFTPFEFDILVSIVWFFHDLILDPLIVLPVWVTLSVSTLVLSTKNVTRQVRGNTCLGWQRSLSGHKLYTLSLYRCRCQGIRYVVSCDFKAVRLTFYWVDGSELNSSWRSHSGGDQKSFSFTKTESQIPSTLYGDCDVDSVW